MGTTGRPGIMLFIAPRSWTNLHPWPLGLLTGKIGLPGTSAGDDKALSPVVSYYGLDALKGFFIYRVFVLGRRCEGSV